MPRCSPQKGYLNFLNKIRKKEALFSALFRKFGLSRLTTGFLDIVGGD